jgi:hypothetical protein
LPSRGSCRREGLAVERVLPSSAKGYPRKSQEKGTSKKRVHEKEAIRSESQAKAKRKPSESQDEEKAGLSLGVKA